MAEEAFGPTLATVVEREPTWALPGLLALGGLALTFALWPAPGAPSVEYGLVALLVVVPAVIVSLAAWLGYYRPRTTRRWIWAGDLGLAVAGTIVRTRRSLLRGDVAFAPDGSYRVDLHAIGRRRIRLLVASAEEARALLAALGLDRREGTSLFRVRTVPWRVSWLVGFAVAWAFVAIFLSDPLCTDTFPFVGFGDLHAGLFLEPLPFALFIAVALRGTLVVGTDGILVRSLVGERFIGYAEIFQVTALAHGVAVVRHDGEQLTIGTEAERIRAGVRCTDPVYDAIKHALSSARGAGTASASVLARAGRDTDAWLAALLRFGQTRAVGYREVAVDERDLFAVLADADAPRDVRIGAVVALAVHPDSAQRTRIAVDEVADPEVRARGLAILRGEDTALHGI